MKKLAFFFLIIGLVFTLVTCNNPTGKKDGDGDGDGDDGEDIEITFDDENLFTMQGDDTLYPGCEITLSENMLDISKYSSVVVDATLYSDEEGTVKATEPTGTDKNLAQFKLLKAAGGSGWSSAENNVFAGNVAKYNMAIDGKTTMTIPSGSSGVPKILLVQANWEGNPGAVKSIRVRSVTFVGKTEGGGIEITVDHVYEIKEGSEFLGSQIDLADWGPFQDISKYESVTVDATLYSAYTDETTNTVATLPTGDNKNLAQFKLLKASGNWGEASNACGPTKYSMAVDGSTTLNIPADASGVPAFLLLQANHKDFSSPEAVTHIKVKTITFTPRTIVVDFALDHIFGDSAVTISGVNKIKFVNASYSNDSGTGNNWDGTTGKAHAALLIFPESWGATETESLKDKTIKINFTIEEHTCSSAQGVTAVEHQIHIQAAQNTPEKDLFNGLKGPDAGGDKPGQKYITLDSTSETGYAAGTGTITVSANALIDASKESGDANDIKGPFILDAVRIVNNGTKWVENASTTHYRCKSYTLVINSVTIQ